jgi:hypothetical protein
MSDKHPDALSYDVKHLFAAVDVLVMELIRIEAKRGVVADDPAQRAYLTTIRLLGERLHENGASYVTMLYVAHCIARDRHFVRSMEIFNAAWAGIGGWPHESPQSIA